MNIFLKRMKKMTSILVMIWTIRKNERNPYVAPGLEETKSSEELGLAPQRYIPPALRKNGFRSWRKCLRGNAQIGNLLKVPQ